MTLYDFLKSIILMLIAIAIVPFLMRIIRSEYRHFLEPYTYVGIVHIHDTMLDPSEYLQQIHYFFKDPHIKGIVLKINSFECCAGTSYSLFNEIQQLKKEYPKPIITLVENVCVFGSYLIASASDCIVASENAIIGGIGTYASLERIKPFFKLYAIPVPTETEDTHNSDSALYNETSQQFTKHVAMARKLSLVTVSNWAQEKIFTGKQACSLGLVTVIGSMNTVIALLKDKALIDGEIQWIEKKYINQNNILSHFLNTICKSLLN